MWTGYVTNVREQEKHTAFWLKKERKHLERDRLK